MANGKIIKLPKISSVVRRMFLFLLLMGGCARKVFFGITDLGSHNRPFLVGGI